MSRSHTAVFATTTEGEDGNIGTAVDASSSSENSVDIFVDDDPSLV